MTIAAVIQAIRRPERGWDNPGYPTGIWEAAGSVTGDASGGNRVIQINLRSTSGLPVGIAYSLEELMVRDADGAASVGDYQTTNFRIAGGVQTQWRRFISLTVPSTATIALQNSESHIRPVFLGIAHANNVAASVTVSIINQDTEVLSAIARGYMWDPRSVLQAAGGYRRPVDGMFQAGF